MVRVRENGTAGSRKSRRKVKTLIETLRMKRALLILMQDNPDPDSIASAAALRRIARSAGDIQCSIAYGGVIGRSENRALANYLGLNFRHIDRVDFKKFDCVALVDTQPRTGNNSLPENVLPDIVLDHHPIRPETRSVAFIDVRSKYGALSTMLFEYLCEAGITPEPPLATALLYAVRTDTQDLGREAVQADVQALEALYPLANTRMLSDIQRGSVTQGYFRDLAGALRQARIHGRCVDSLLDEVDNPDIISELADLFLRYEGAEWSLCGGLYQGKAWLSLRSSRPDRSARDVMRVLVSGVGTGGGHGMSAGGQVPLAKGTKNEWHAVRKKIRDRLLREIGEEHQRPKKLVDL